MTELTLAAAVRNMASHMQGLSDIDLSQPWAWRFHDEGTRFALIGTYHELRALAVELAAERTRLGIPRTAAQHALAQYHAAFRDLEAILLGVTEEAYDIEPAVAEWPLRYVIGHAAATERQFFALVHYGLERQREGGQKPSRIPEGEADRLTIPRAEFNEMMHRDGLAELMAFYETHHDHVLQTFVDMTGEELEGPSLWWEGEELSLKHRLHRFDAHLRQHTIQAEKTLEMIGHEATEARRLLRLCYQALAEVEGILLGAGTLALEERQAMAQTIVERAEDAVERVNQSRALIGAIRAGDSTRVQQLLDETPALANAINEKGVPVLLDALYYGKRDIARQVAAAGAEMSIFEAAALGDMQRVREEIEAWPEDINAFARDGFTPLQLAAFFGNEEVAQWLMEQDADVNAVSRNEQRVTALHSATASGNLSIVRALVERGAGVNAAQQNEGRPLHNAVAGGNIEMVRLLLAHGAEPSAPLTDGRTPLDLAREQRRDDIATLLENTSRSG